VAIRTPIAPRSPRNSSVCTRVDSPAPPSTSISSGWVNVFSQDTPIGDPDSVV